MENEPTHEEMYARAIEVAAYYRAEAYRSREVAYALSDREEGQKYFDKFVFPREMQVTACLQMIVATFNESLLKVSDDVSAAAEKHLEGEE